MTDASVLEVCEIHKSHTPANLTVEVHHVIPVAWQLTWGPVVPPFPGNDPDGRGELWDARTVPLCPTGHRNVHAWITRFMHALAPGGGAAGSTDPAAAYKAAKGGSGLQQAQWAYQALVRFTAVGGSLQQLVAAGEWGES